MSDRPTIPQEYVDWRTKGVWWPGEPITLKEFAARRENLFAGPFTWPLMVLRESALQRNVAALADFTERHGLLFAPHGKTSMAPALIRRQLDAGAWGISAATPNQVLAQRRFGVRRILLANELLDPGALRWMAEELNRDPELELLFYVDSAEGGRGGLRGRRPEGATFAGAGGTRGPRRTHRLPYSRTATGRGGCGGGGPRCGTCRCGRLRGPAQGRQRRLGVPA